MLQYIKRLSNIRFTARISTNPTIFRADEEGDDIVYREMIGANDIRSDDLMIIADIVDPDGNALNDGIKVTINGAVYTYTTMFNYIPVSLFPIDGDTKVRVPVKISDEFGNSMYAVCPVTLYYQANKLIDGKSVGRHIISVIENYCR